MLNEYWWLLKRLFKVVQNIKFRSVRDHFQNKLKTVIRKINSSNKVLIFADKTRNLYKLDKDAYNMQTPKRKHHKNL